MVARLAAYVAVMGPAGLPVLLGPDDEVPGWALAQITNPAAWASGAPPTAPVAPAAAAAPRRRRAPKKRVEKAPAVVEPSVESGGEQSDAGDPGADTEQDDDVDADPVATSAMAPPPMTGVDGTRQRWADYAAAVGVAVDEGWLREDIISAVADAGKPVD